MRNYIDIVEGFTPSEYGYWINPNGEIIGCGSITHGEAAANQLGVEFDPDDGDDERERVLVDEAMGEGAIRIVASNGSSEFNAEWAAMGVTSEAKKSLLNVIALYGTREHFILQDEYFTDYRSAVRYIRKG